MEAGLINRGESSSLAVSGRSNNMARKILVVDDQKDILLILSREFRRVPGVSVIVSTTAFEALEMLTKTEVDVVISDVRLGLDSGFDLVRKIKLSYPKVSLILMSAYRSPGNRQQAEELGAILFLEKPFQISGLVEAVKNYFDLREKPAAIPDLVPARSRAPVNKTSSLSHFRLEDLVQLFCLNGRNMLITVTPGPGQPIGKIYIQQGCLTHVEFNGLTGDEGFLALMQHRDPHLKVKDWTAPVPVTVKTNWQSLLLQSAVRYDNHSDRQVSGA